MLLIGLCLSAATAAAWGQERTRVEEPKEKEEVIVAEEAVEILGAYDKVTFPPPPPPKVKPLPRMKVLTNIERHLPSGQKLTMRWIEPIEVDYTPPTPPERKPSTLTEEELAELEELYSREKYFTLSATVFDERVTFLRWSHERKTYFAWSNVNFGHLAAVSRFKVGKRNYSFFMGYGRIDTESVSLDPWPGKMPEFPDNLPQFEPLGKVPDEALESIVALHKLYAREGDRLARLYAKRQEASTAWKAWREANPPEPKDIEVYFWPSKRANIMREPLARPEVIKRAERFAQSKPVFDKIRAERERRMNLPKLEAPREVGQ